MFKSLVRCVLLTLVLAMMLSATGVSYAAKRKSVAGVATNDHITSSNRGADKIPAKKINLMVLGDSLGDGIWSGLYNAFRKDKNIKVIRKSKPSTGFVRLDYYDWNAKLGQILKRTRVDVAVVMVGANDRQTIITKTGRFRPGSKRWREVYASRVDRFIKQLKNRKVKIYWVGLPITRKKRFTAHMKMLNEIFSERAAANNIVFVNIWKDFTTANGRYSANGKDINGRMRKLRANDGVHFTRRGYRKLALAAERYIRADLREDTPPVRVVEIVEKPVAIEAIAVKPLVRVVEIVEKPVAVEAIGVKPLVRVVEIVEKPVAVEAIAVEPLVRVVEIVEKPVAVEAIAVKPLVRVAEIIEKPVAVEAIAVEPLVRVAEIIEKPVAVEAIAVEPLVRVAEIIEKSVGVEAIGVKPLARPAIVTQKIEPIFKKIGRSEINLPQPGLLMMALQPLEEVVVEPALSMENWPAKIKKQQNFQADADYLAKNLQKTEKKGLGEVIRQALANEFQDILSIVQPDKAVVVSSKTAVVPNQEAQLSLIKVLPKRQQMRKVATLSLDSGLPGQSEKAKRASQDARNVRPVSSKSGTPDDNVEYEDKTAGGQDAFTGTSALSSVAAVSGVDFKTVTDAPGNLTTIAYRTLLRGDAVPPKTGRGDDFSWPRD